MEKEINDLITKLYEKLSKKLDPNDEIDISKELEEVSNRKREFLRNTFIDGLPQWKTNVEPVLAGTQFVIARSWQQDVVTSNLNYVGRQLIKIDPGVAFGSVHPTTLLCMEALEQYWQGGHLLDIGTGTGILAITAAFLQPQAGIEAFDVSTDIVEHALLHLELNDLVERVQIRRATIEDYPEQTYDFVTANLLPDLLDKLKSDIIARVKPGGILVLSGFMDKNEGKIYAQFDWDYTSSTGLNADEIAAIFGNSMEIIDRKVNNGWVALVLRSNSGNQ
jgi:ribosomal protein L11 methyltransferase